MSENLLSRRMILVVAGGSEGAELESEIPSRPRCDQINIIQAKTSEAFVKILFDARMVCTPNNNSSRLSPDSKTSFKLSPTSSSFA